MTGKTPNGKGMFIWLLGRLVKEYGSTASLADYLRDYGFQWVDIKAHDGRLLGSGYSDNHIELLDEFIPELERVGVEPHGWGYNYGETNAWRKMNNWNDKEVSRAVEAIERWGFLSWMANAEKEFKTSNSADPAKRLMVQLRDAIDIPLALSSYKFPTSHPLFPWNEFLELCDFANPQVYWQAAYNPVEQLEKSVMQWKAIRDVPMVVAGTVYPEPKYNWWPTGEQVAAFNEAAKVMPEVVGTCYWEMYYLTYREDNKEAVEQFEWEGVPEQPEPADDIPTRIGYIIDELENILVELSGNEAPEEPEQPEPEDPPVEDPPEEPEPEQDFWFAYKGENKAPFYLLVHNDDNDREKFNLFDDHRIAYNQKVKYLGYFDLIAQEWRVILTDAGKAEAENRPRLNTLKLARNIEGTTSDETKHRDVRLVEYQGMIGVVFSTDAKVYKNSLGVTL